MGRSVPTPWGITSNCGSVLGLSQRHVRLDLEAVRCGVAAVVGRVGILVDRRHRLALHIDAALMAYRVCHERGGDGQDAYAARRFPEVARVVRQCAADRSAAELAASW